MQSFIFFMLLLSSTALAGPIGRYPIHKRHEGHDDPIPSPTTTSASDGVSVTGAFFNPPPTNAPPTDGFRIIATVTRPRTFEFIEDGVKTAVPAAASVGLRDVDTSATTTTAPAGKYAPTAAAEEEGIVEAVGAPAYTAAEVTSSPAAARSSTAAASTDNKALALAQNKFYATLTASSSCDPKDPNVLNACINGAYAQCNPAGSYVMYTQCGKPLGCFALPLENGPGISVACTSADDAAFRMGLKSGSELEKMLGGGGSASSSVVPSTVRSMVTVTSTPMRTATSTAAVVTSSASAPVTSSAVVAPTSSPSAVPTTASSSAAVSTTTATASSSSSSSSTSSTPTTTQAPATTSSPPTPTSTTAPPNNQAPVVTAIPIGERYVTSAGVVITTTIYQ